MFGIIIGLSFILIASSLTIFIVKGRKKLNDDLVEIKQKEEINRKEELLNNIKKQTLILMMK